MTQETQGRRRSLVNIGRAWKRVMLDEKGALHADAKLILRDLFDQSGFYSSRQVFPGQSDLTVARAAKRELVTHIVCLINKSDAAIAGGKKTNAIETEARDVDKTLEQLEQAYDD